MQDQLKAIREHVIEELKSVQDSNALEQLRVRVLGKKGELTAILRGMGKVPAEERPASRPAWSTKCAKSSNRPSTKRAAALTRARKGLPPAPRGAST